MRGLSKLALDRERELVDGYKRKHVTKQNINDYKILILMLRAI